MTTVNGLPAHVLFVHAVVVLVPVAAVLLVLAACWPAARRKLSTTAAAVAGVALVSVPITTEAGEWLEHHLPRTALLHVHTELGDTMLPWAIGLFVVAALVAARELTRTRRLSALAVGGGPGAAAHSRPGAGPGGPAVTAMLAVLAVLVAVGATVTVFRIGESGSRAAWDGRVSAAPVLSGKHAPTND